MLLLIQVGKPQIKTVQLHVDHSKISAKAFTAL
jgi:hypothetical protein